MPTPSSIYTIPEAREDKLAASLGTGLADALSGLAQQRAQQVQQRNQSGALQALLGLEPQAAQQAVHLPESALSELIKNQLRAPQEEAFAQLLNQITNPNAEQVEPQQPQLGKVGGVKPRLTAQQATKLAELQLKREEIGRKQSLQKEQQQLKKQAHIDKLTEPYVSEINKQGDAAKSNIERLNQMSELIQKGDLNQPAFAAIVDKISHIPVVGIDLSSWLTADSQTFNKLSKDFLKDAKGIFGSRLTDADLKAFLQTVPTLTQSDGGKLQVINNLMRAAEGALVKERIAEEVIKENNGMRPSNIKSLVEKRAKPILDQLAKDFARGGIKRITKSPLKYKEEEEEKNLLGRPTVNKIRNLFQ